MCAWMVVMIKIMRERAMEEGAAGRKDGGRSEDMESRARRGAEQRDEWKKGNHGRIGTATIPIHKTASITWKCFSCPKQQTPN